MNDRNKIKFLIYVLMLSIIHCKWIAIKTYKVIHNFQKLYKTNTFWTHIYIIQPSLNFPINSFWKYKLPKSTKQFTILKLIKQNSKKLYKSNTFWTHTYHDMMICLIKQTTFCLHLFELGVSTGWVRSGLCLNRTRLETFEWVKIEPKTDPEC